MRTVVYRLLLVYLCILLGVMVKLPGMLGSAVRLAQYPALLAWAFSVLVTARVRRPHSFHWAFLGFIVWNAASLAWTLSPSDTVAHLTRYTVLFVTALALWDVSATEHRAKMVAQTLVAGGYLLVALAAYGHHAGAGKVLDANRFGAGGMDPNDMAITLAVLVPVAWGLALTGGGSPRRPSVTWIANLAFPLAALAGIVLSGSRGALLAGIPGFVYVLATLPRIPATGRAVLAAMAGIVLAYGIHMDLSYQLSRLGSAFGSVQAGELAGRELIWQAGEDVLQRHALIGVGSGAFPEAIRSYPSVPRHPVTGEPYVAHNTYLSVMAETGSIGLVLFVTTLITAAVAVWRRGERTERISWLIALVTWAIGVSSVTWDYRPYTWLFFLTALIVVSRPRARTLAVVPTMRRESPRSLPLPAPLLEAV